MDGSLVEDVLVFRLAAKALPPLTDITLSVCMRVKTKSESEREKERERERERDDRLVD